MRFHDVSRMASMPAQQNLIYSMSQGDRNMVIHHPKTEHPATMGGMLGKSDLLS
jgi:hypothetical protein